MLFHLRVYIEEFDLYSYQFSHVHLHWRPRVDIVANILTPRILTHKIIQFKGTIKTLIDFSGERWKDIGSDLKTHYFYFSLEQDPDFVVAEVLEMFWKRAFTLRVSDHLQTSLLILGEYKGRKALFPLKLLENYRYPDVLRGNRKKWS